ncbi:MAG TPA: hypothetical protein VLX91_05630 [Candidatus Acidoferrales bacterium]|nr:hypothetical protein [Candidatus Acidoferrales bacterium]
MSLLKEIQNDAVNQNVDLPTLLRKCKLLATKLKNDDFKQWDDKELNGYNSKEKLPDYRILNVQSYGHFVGPFGRQLKNAPISRTSLPKELRDLVTKAHIYEGVGSLSSLVKDKKSDVLSSFWPAEVVAKYGQQMYEDMNCIGAWRAIGRNQIEGILDTIRNRVLSFVLEIESIVPDVGEVQSGDQRISKGRITQIYKTVIHGNVGNVSSGSANVSQTAQFEIIENDFATLEKYLAGVGISKEDIAELKEAIKIDPPASSQNFGKRVAGWVGKMVTKAASGAWGVSTSVAADIISKALCNYYGIH